MVSLKSYIDFWKGAFDFSGITSRRDYVISMLIHFLLVLIMRIIEPLIILFSAGTVCDSFVTAIVFGFGSFLPMLAITVRRLNDAGYSVKSFCWLLVPVLGQIAFLARLLSKSNVKEVTSNE